MPDTQPRTGQEADFTFTVGDLPNDVLKVTRFEGTEGISELYQFRIDFCSDDAELDFNEIVGKSCSLEIAGMHGSRYLNGIVRSFERTKEGTHLTHYAAQVVPMHWLLTKRYKSRIFQSHNCADMTVPGIIKQVFTDAGIPEEHFRFALEKEYNEHDFVVQYRETDMDFISRLAEEEGIFFFFEHTADGYTMVFGDSQVAHSPLPEMAEYPYRSAADLVPEKEYVYAVRDRQEIQYGAICLDDYTFTQPSTELRATVKADEYTSLEFSDYPGEYDDKAVGDRYAQVRLEEHQCKRRVVHMSSMIRALTPGYKFTLVDHPSATLNIEYMITHVSHRATQPPSGQEEAGGDQGVYHETDFRAIPAEISFRPPRKTPRPVVLGSQTALVVGPSGEEVYTDDDGYGRVKVQFHWDRENEYDEKSSCWIRVSQGWAGGNYGMIFLPRVGQEVIVDFLEGNPDCPIITGRVYNHDNMPPYGLPAEKTKSTIKSRSSVGGGGFNELRFEDKKDSEQIFMHGQKDLDIRILNDEKDWIGRDKHEIIEGGQKKKIGGGEGRSVGGDQATKVGGNRCVLVTGDNRHSVDGNMTIFSGGDMWVSGAKAILQGDSYADVHAPQVVIEGDAQVTIKCGGSFVTVDPSGVTISGPIVKINSGGAAGSAQSPTVAAELQPAEPLEAVTGDPGKDFTYSQQPLPYEPFEHAPVHNEDDATEEQTHWIGIELLDDNGEPLAGERYVVQLPDGTKVARGYTDKEGKAEIKGIDPGSCQVTFPDLDGMTWDAGPPTAQNGAAGGGGGGAPGGNGQPPAPPSMPPLG